MKNLYSFYIYLVTLCRENFYANFYKKYKSYANPLYFPWLCDRTFYEINKKYDECHSENFYKDGRYLQYVLANHASRLDAPGDFIECGVMTGKSYGFPMCEGA